MQIGQKIIRLESIDSTNNYAANLLKEGLISHGAVILADEQFAGKGQRGAVWLSHPCENLLVSFLLIPDNLSVNNQVALTHYISVCVVDFLAKIGISAKIKWPNDIYVNERKMGGVLIENCTLGMKVTSSVLGLGLNINQKTFEGLNATSVFNEVGKFKSINEILFGLIEEMNEKWPLLESGNYHALREKYLNKLFLLNEESIFQDADGEFTGIIRGTTEHGLLVVQKESEIIEYDLKEISFIYRSTL